MREEINLCEAEKKNPAAHQDGGKHVHSHLDKIDLLSERSGREMRLVWRFFFEKRTRWSCVRFYAWSSLDFGLVFCFSDAPLSNKTNLSFFHMEIGPYLGLKSSCTKNFGQTIQYPQAELSRKHLPEVRFVHQDWSNENIPTGSWCLCIATTQRLLSQIAMNEALFGGIFLESGSAPPQLSLAFRTVFVCAVTWAPWCGSIRTKTIFPCSFPPNIVFLLFRLWRHKNVFL